ncbi:SAP30-binding protein [Rhizophlyctis rosea]|uniref:SAP30-binding protein n=1 Tax=Rhizophlyctis rosea TaxID=64517 RepID=A0AAD5SF82_9FUNG|nr:SAP30-binding protein [Rhizophlyctis rosea]
MNVLGIEYSDSEDEQDSPSPVPKPAAAPKPQPTAELKKESSPTTGPQSDNETSSTASQITTTHVKVESPAKSIDEVNKEEPVESQEAPLQSERPVATSRTGEHSDEEIGRPFDDGTRTSHMIRNLLREAINPSTHGYSIPPEPEGECDPAMQDKITKWLQLKAKGTLFNERLTRTHAFRNPSIMSKMIEFLDVDEIGSNYSKESFDPHGFPPELYYDQILKAQGMTREKPPAIPGAIPSNVAASLQQAQQRAIQFVSNINKMHNQTIPSTTSTSTTGKRRSKWDQPADGQSKRRG